MSVIDPNNRPKILVDDFIKLAKEHLTTIQGLANTQTTYSTAAGATLPGFCYWSGYFAEDIEQLPDQAEANLKKVSSEFKPLERTRSLGEEIFDVDAELTGQGVVYPTVRTSDGKSHPNYGGTAQTSFVATNAEAKIAAESYLGRSMTDAEWNDLVSITFAEATTNQTERAWVMGSILNRTRIGYTPLGIQNKRYSYSTVTDIINQPWQYQPVTGTRLDPGPKRAFIDGPNRSNATSIYGAASKLLKDVPKAYINFTSNDPAAYKAGTNINYLYRLRANPNSKIVGGTIFGF